MCLGEKSILFYFSEASSEVLHKPEYKVTPPPIFPMRKSEKTIF
jgi:hypothetical protein